MDHGERAGDQYKDSRDIKPEHNVPRRPADRHHVKHETHGKQEQRRNGKLQRIQKRFPGSSGTPQQEDREEKKDYRSRQMRNAAHRVIKARN